MGIEYRITPIDLWPGKLTRLRRRAPFKVDYLRTHTLLERELGYVHARNVALRCAVSPMQIRQDGKLYASARPDHPGVILCFDCSQGSMAFPCDTFDEWLANLHAIIVVLEDLRRMDRYGVGANASARPQYKGWQALPAPGSASDRSFSDARRLIEVLIGRLVEWTDREAAETALREAERKTHPDLGGDVEKFKRVQSARAVLLSPTLNTSH